MSMEKEKITGYPGTVGPGGVGKESKAADPQAGAGKDDSCRCKEASKMGPRELLRLMISDLTFWKKADKE